MIADVDCRQSVEGAVAVINEEVTDYKVLLTSPVSDQNQITAIDGEVGRLGLLEKFKSDFSKDSSNQLPEVHRYPHPEVEVYFIKYASMPLILKKEGGYNVLSNEYECLGESIIKNFMLNKRYYAGIRYCCESDGCVGIEFMEVKKP